MCNARFQLFLSECGAIAEVNENTDIAREDEKRLRQDVAAQTKASSKTCGLRRLSLSRRGCRDDVGASSVVYSSSVGFLVFASQERRREKVYKLNFELSERLARERPIV